MSESRDHRRLVVALIKRMIDRAITVAAADAPGWPRPELVGGRRPDVIGLYRAGASAVAAEAKRGPELWDCQRQLEDIALALPNRGPIGAGALLIVAVLPGWEMEAIAVCSTIASPRTSHTVWSLTAA